MSCEKCGQFQESEMTSYFRWKNANIEIRACKEHLLEVFEVLKNYNKKKNGKSKL